MQWIAIYKNWGKLIVLMTIGGAVFFETGIWNSGARIQEPGAQ